jgi:hypothetical protein
LLKLQSAFTINRLPIGAKKNFRFPFVSWFRFPFEAKTQKLSVLHGFLLQCPGWRVEGKRNGKWGEDEEYGEVGREKR